MTILNLNRAYNVNSRLIRKITSYIFDACGLKGEVGLIFLTDRRIRTLNKQYKGEDRPTDVLSFDLGTGYRKNAPISGEIFISIDRALANSRIYGTGLQEEFILYVIHGILHLSGYDDECRKDAARMAKKQSEILGKICKRENLSKVLTPR